MVQQRIPLQLRIIDPAGGVDFTTLGRKANLKAKPGMFVVKDYTDCPPGEPNAARDVIHRTHCALAERLRLMNSRGVDLHRVTVEDPLIVLVIDEFLSLNGELTKSIRGELGDILRLGRKAAIIVWAFSQSGNIDHVGAVRNTFAQRVCLRLMTTEESVTAMGDAGRGLDCSAISPSTPGVGYMVVDGQPKPQRFRAALVSKDEERMLAVGRFPQRPGGQGVARFHRPRVKPAKQPGRLLAVAAEPEKEAV